MAMTMEKGNGNGINDKARVVTSNRRSVSVQPNDVKLIVTRCCASRTSPCVVLPHFGHPLYDTSNTARASSCDRCCNCFHGI